MNQADHWDYTIQEWHSAPFWALLVEAFKLPIKTVWDVGACVGGWSQVVHEYLPEAQIYAFEPFAENFLALKERAIPNVEPIPYAIWYGARTVRAMWRGSNIGAIFIEEVDTTMATDTGQTFMTCPLEGWNFPQPDLIKFDVEGAEKNIFKNSSMLKRVPQILLEWHFVGFDSPDEFLAETVPSHRIVARIDDGMLLLRRKDLCESAS